MVLVTVSTTFCMYFGLDDLVDKNIRADCLIRSLSVSDGNDVDFAKNNILSSAE